jgi:hypothetical protein
MTDLSEILLEKAFHLDGHPVLEKVLLLGKQFRGKRADALVGVFAVGGAAEIQFRVQELMSAFSAPAGGVVLEKFHLGVALGTPGFKNRILFPIATVLSGTFHDFLRLCGGVNGCELDASPLPADIRRGQRTGRCRARLLSDHIPKTHGLH